MNKNNTVAIIDRGGRGAALAFAYSKSPYVKKILVIPGSPLIQLNCKKEVLTFPQIEITDVKAIVALCKSEGIDLIDVAQDDAVAAGVTDLLLKNGFLVTGPSKKAGKIEWSKAYSRRLMKKVGINQPEFRAFDSVQKGKEYLKKQPDQAWFVKADGLVRGKGALPAANNREALERIKQLSEFGVAAKTYLIEKWVKSDNHIAEEFSAFAICDGNSFQIIGYAQDHKRVFDGDLGDNTGGIGVSCPPLVVTGEIEKQVKTIFSKVFKQLKKEENPYRGVLYLGGMIIGKKVFVVEFNARWGDPEAEALVPGITTDFFEISYAVATQKLRSIAIQSDKKARVVVTGCAKGYPGNLDAALGKEIRGLNEAAKIPGVIVFGASMREKGGKVWVDGGRLFHIVATGNNVIEARQRAYHAMSLVSVAGHNLHFRTDIGWRDVNRLNKQ